MFLMFPILFKCISLCRLSCCGWMLPDPTTALICTRTTLAVHRRVGPPVTSCTGADPEILGWECWTSSLQHSFFGCQKWVSHPALGVGFSSRLRTSPLDSFYLWVLTDRLAACPTAEWCLGRSPEPRQAEGQRDKEPAVLGKVGSCEETFRAGDGVCALPTPGGLRWDEMFRQRGWNGRGKGTGENCQQLDQNKVCQDKRQHPSPVIWRHRLSLTCSFSVPCLKMMSVRLTSFVFRF